MKNLVAKQSIFILFIAFTVVLFISSVVLADKITFKSGSVVEGKIVEETDKYVKVRIAEVPVTFYKDEIKNIEVKPLTAQTSTTVQAPKPEELPYANQPQVKKYLELIQKEPHNYEHYLALAGFYAGTGDGDSVLRYVEKALELNAQESIKKGAYMTAAMGAYYAGMPKKSYEYTEKEMKVHPDNQMAKDFRGMLEAVSKRDWGGDFPEKVSLGGYKSAGEMGRAIMKQGTFRLGEKEDKFTSEVLNFRISAPAEWFKEVGRAPNQLLYAKVKNKQHSATILITTDEPDSGNKTVLDFSTTVKKELQKQIPGIMIDGPIEVTIAGRSASKMDMKDVANDLHMEWYQLLINGTVISFEYLNTLSQFDSDHDAFKKTLDSFIVEE